MGTWGTGISSNDTYSDIHEQFIDLYNDGLSVSEITERLITENQETINLPEDATNFWFAMANAQWECKELDKELLLKVEQIIHTGEDLRIWKELDASPNDLKAREKILVKFLTKIKVEKDKPRKRTKKKLYTSIFKKGDCLTYVMNNGNFGGAFVLTDEQNTPVGTNYIAITTIDKVEKPTVSDFMNAEVYIRHTEEISFKSNAMVKNWVDQPQIGGFSAMSFKKGEIEIEVIGQLPIYKNYTIRTDRFVGFGWMALRLVIPSKEEYVKINGKAKQTLKLSEWTQDGGNSNTSKITGSWLKKLLGFQ
jgi:hypothetical protein